MTGNMDALYPLILFLHGLTRWLVLVGGLWLVAASIPALGKAGPVGASPVLLPWRIYMGGFHLQLLLGIFLLVVSPLAQAAWGDMGAAMRTRPVRFFIAEHTTMMIVAFVIAQIGSARTRKAFDARGAARTSLVYGGLSLLLVLAAIPWPFFGAIARPLLRSW